MKKKIEHKGRHSHTRITGKLARKLFNAVYRNKKITSRGMLWGWAEIEGIIPVFFSTENPSDSLLHRDVPIYATMGLA